MEQALAAPESISSDRFAAIFKGSDLNRVWPGGRNILHWLVQLPPPPVWINVAFQAFDSLNDTLRNHVASVIPVRPLQQIVLSYLDFKRVALQSKDDQGLSPLNLASSILETSDQGHVIISTKRNLLVAEEFKILHEK